VAGNVADYLQLAPTLEHCWNCLADTLVWAKMADLSHRPVSSTPTSTLGHQVASSSTSHNSDGKWGRGRWRSPPDTSSDEEAIDQLELRTALHRQGSGYETARLRTALWLQEADYDEPISTPGRRVLHEYHTALQETHTPRDHPSVDHGDYPG
jgi:hypothetical protein